MAEEAAVADSALAGHPWRTAPSPWALVGLMGAPCVAALQALRAAAASPAVAGAGAPPGLLPHPLQPLWPKPSLLPP